MSSWMSSPATPAWGTGSRASETREIMPEQRQPVRLPLHPPGSEKDPVCGMRVAADTPHRHSHEGQAYLFCCGGCQAKFAANPDKYLSTAGRLGVTTPPASEGQAASPSSVADYTCPMHPQIVRNAPGSCPICGMALEPRTVNAEQPANPELVDM